MITGIFAFGWSLAFFRSPAATYVAPRLWEPPLLAVATSGIPRRKPAARVSTSPRPPLPQRALDRDSPPRLPVPQSALERISPRVPPLFLNIRFLLLSALLGAGRSSLRSAAGCRYSVRTVRKLRRRSGRLIPRVGEDSGDRRPKSPVGVTAAPLR